MLPCLRQGFFFFLLGKRCHLLDRLVNSVVIIIIIIIIIMWLERRINFFLRPK